MRSDPLAAEDLAAAGMKHQFRQPSPETAAAQSQGSLCAAASAAIMAAESREAAAAGEGADHQRIQAGCFLARAGMLLQLWLLLLRLKL